MQEQALAEHEWPGLMACRSFGQAQPVENLHNDGPLHRTIQTGELVETPAALGGAARLRCARLWPNHRA